MKSPMRVLTLGLVAGLVGAGAIFASTASAGISAEQNEDPVVIKAQQNEDPIIGKLGEMRPDLNLGR